MRYFLLICYSIAAAVAANAQLTGRVWQDYGQTATTARGVAQVSITAYDATGQAVASTTTDAAGRYRLRPPVGIPVRLVFHNLPLGQYPSAGHATQHFVSSPAEVNLGLYSPAHHTGPNPRLAQTIFSTQLPNDSINIPSLKILNPQTKETAIPLFHNTNNNNNKLPPLGVGGLWALAYARSSQRLFAAALVKRHSPLGTLGAGGIYVQDLKTNAIESYVSLNAAPQPPEGEKNNSPIGGWGAGLHDSLTFAQVGKVGLGGMDLSDDDRHLFVMNLYDRKLYQIAIPQDGSRPTAADIQSFKVPLTGCMGGEARPFAVKYFGGKVYVGVTCDAQKSQKPEDLKIIIYQANLSSSKSQANWQEVSITPPLGAGGLLSYPRGTLDYQRGNWNPWTDDQNQAVVPGTNYWLIYPQPMLADIEFDTDGSMILSLMDRLGHQTGDGQLFWPKGALQLHTYQGLSGGDVLRLAWDKDHYELEQNGRVGGRTSKGQNNHEGPGGGEFYFDDAFTAGGVVWHKETATGGLALLPQTDELVVSSREPETDHYTTGGMKWFSNQTGATTRALSVFPSGQQPGYFWKTNNVGDVEVIGEMPPTEVGDRVWEDCNANGLQDADEPALANVTLQLFQKGKLVGTTQTNAEGLYRFSDQNTENGLQSRTDYEIRLSLAQQPYGTLRLTATGQGADRELDNDAVANDKVAVVKFTTTAPGENVHHLDVGLRCLSSPTISELDQLGLDQPVGLALYPNPTTGRSVAVYKSEQSAGSITLQLTDASGRVIETRTGMLERGHHRAVFDLSRQPASSYEITIIDNATRTTKKLIKQ